MDINNYKDHNIVAGTIICVNDFLYDYFTKTIYHLSRRWFLNTFNWPLGNRRRNRPGIQTGEYPREAFIIFLKIRQLTPNPQLIPIFLGPVKSKNFIELMARYVTHLKKVETLLFMITGPEGAIVEEMRYIMMNVAG